MALTRLNNTSLVNADVGKVLQVVEASTSTQVAVTSGTSFSDTTLSATITPSSTSNKILVSCTQIIQVYNNGSPYGTGRYKIVQTIGGSSTDINDGGDSANGNVFVYDYGGSGVNVYRPTTLSMLLSPNTTSAITYKTQIALGSNGGFAIYCFNNKDDGIMTLMEIAG